MKATFIKKLEGTTLDARVYHVSPRVPYMEIEDYTGEYEEIPRTAAYLLVVANPSKFDASRNITDVFHCDSNGKVIYWGAIKELCGELNHEKALRELGVTTIE